MIDWRETKENINESIAEIARLSDMSEAEIKRKLINSWNMQVYPVSHISEIQIRPEDNNE